MAFLLRAELIAWLIKYMPKKPKYDENWECQQCGAIGKPQVGIHFHPLADSTDFSCCGQYYVVCPRRDGKLPKCSAVHVTDALSDDVCNRYGAYYIKKAVETVNIAANCGTCQGKKPGNRKRSLGETDDSSPAAKRFKTSGGSSSPVKSEPVAGPSKPRKPEIAVEGGSSPLQKAKKTATKAVPKSTKASSKSTKAASKDSEPDYIDLCSESEIDFFEP